jgi:type I restriction enzyme, S subunit
VRGGWQTSTLGEVCERVTVGHVGTTTPHYREDGVLFLRTQNVGAFGLNLETVKYITSEFHASLKKSTVKAGDILMSRVITHSVHCALIPRELGPTNCANVILVRPGKLVVPEYLAHYIRSPQAQRHLLARKVGSAQVVVNTAVVQNWPVPLPPLAEQQCIVTILDEALAGLETATANAEKNLRNARELFESYLQSVFDQTKPLSLTPSNVKSPQSWRGAAKFDDTDSTRTGGRAATTRHIVGKRSLCVGMPKSRARIGWEWRSLDSLARMESGHTPSRRYPKYWGGDVPWIGIRDAKAAHGREIVETLETTNTLGLENSSARLLPAHTVCLSRTASVGYVTMMGRPMATSQDFVNWVCSDQLYPPFLMYLFLAQSEEIFKFSSGAVHQTIYFPEAKAFHICQPSMNEQYQIVETLDALREQAEKLEAVYERKIAGLIEMKQSILRKAFSGELTWLSSRATKEAAE